MYVIQALGGGSGSGANQSGILDSVGILYSLFVTGDRLRLHCPVAGQSHDVPPARLIDRVTVSRG